MAKNRTGSVVLVLAVASFVYGCSSESGTGTPSAGGTGGRASASGGAGGTGAPSGTGGMSGGATGGGAASTGGTSGGGGAAGTITTLAAACAKNCGLAAGLDTCSTTTAVCEQSCMTTHQNTSNVNADLGRQYMEMMICVANNPKFSTSAGYVCAKPERALNKWSPGPDSECEQLICDWNCNDGTSGNFDPFLNIRCACSSI